MKKERTNAPEVKTDTPIKRIAEPADDALLQVTGGRGETGTLDQILSEISSWLDKHPNATKREVYCLLKEKREANADRLTDEEQIILDELLKSFVS